MGTSRATLAVLLGLLFPLGSATETPPNAEPSAPPVAALVIPDTARARANPVPASPESIEVGTRLFASQCSMCHGRNGDGSGDLAKRLGLSVPDFTNPKTLAKRTDGELFYVLTMGHGDMPADGERQAEARRWDLVNAARAMSKE